MVFIKEIFTMNSYGFLVAHGYEILKGYLEVESEEDAKEKIINKEWNDIIDEYDTDVFTEDYEVVELWQIK